MQRIETALNFEQQGFVFRVEEQQLIIAAAGQPVVRLCLAPAVDGKVLSAGPWEPVDADHITSKVAGLGSVHVGLRYGYPAYWVETDREHFDLITYFPDSPFEGLSWHAFSDDEDDRDFDADLDAATVVSSNYAYFHADQDRRDPAAATGLDCPADWAPGWIWNVPVRAIAMQAPSGWLGLSVPGPLPVGFTRFRMQRRKFCMPFEILRPGCDGGQMPVVYLAPGLSRAEDVLDIQREITGKMGLLKPRHGAQPGWWSAPFYKCVGEVFRRNDWRVLVPDENGDLHTNLTSDNLCDWARRVKESVRSPELNVEFDQVYFPCYGEYTPLDELGGIDGMRHTIDALREEGIHVGLYIHLYLISSASGVYQRRPDVVCKQSDPEFVMIHGVPVGSQQTLHILDWTHPGARDEMMEIIRFLISDEPGCLNADWLAINNNMGIDLREFELHDPRWGIGDLMTMKVRKMVYEQVKQVKPHALVKSQSAADCYMQPYTDRLNAPEHWRSRTDIWYKRGRIVTRTHPTHVLHSSCAWTMTRYKYNEYYIGILAWQVPELDAVTHTMYLRGLDFKELREKDFRRRRAGIQCYLNAPANLTHRAHVDWHDFNHVTAWRKYTEGPLAGFYASLALSPRCLVTYSATRAVAAASESRLITMPLPPDVRVSAVEAVPHEGDPRPHEYGVTDDGRLRMHVADAAGDIMLYRISYTKGD